MRASYVCKKKRQSLVDLDQFGIFNAGRTGNDEMTLVQWLLSTGVHWPYHVSRLDCMEPLMGWGKRRGFLQGMIKSRHRCRSAFELIAAKTYSVCISSACHLINDHGRGFLVGV